MKLWVKKMNQAARPIPLNRNKCMKLEHDAKWCWWNKKLEIKWCRPIPIRVVPQLWAFEQTIILSDHLAWPYILISFKHGSARENRGQRVGLTAIILTISNSPLHPSYPGWICSQVQSNNSCSEKDTNCPVAIAYAPSSAPVEEKR